MVAQLVGLSPPQRGCRRIDSGCLDLAEFSVDARENLRSIGPDDDGVFDERAAESVLVVGRLDLEDHALLEWRVDAWCEHRRVVELDSDSVADVVAFVVW